MGLSWCRCVDANVLNRDVLLAPAAWYSITTVWMGTTISILRVMSLQWFHKCVEHELLFKEYLTPCDSTKAAASAGTWKHMEWKRSPNSISRPEWVINPKLYSYCSYSTSHAVGGRTAHSSNLQTYSEKLNIKPVKLLVLMLPPRHLNTVCRATDEVEKELAWGTSAKINYHMWAGRHRQKLSKHSVVTNTIQCTSTYGHISKFVLSTRNIFSILRVLIPGSNG